MVGISSDSPTPSPLRNVNSQLDLTGRANLTKTSAVLPGGQNSATSCYKLFCVWGLQFSGLFLERTVSTTGETLGVDFREQSRLEQTEVREWSPDEAPEEKWSSPVNPASPQFWLWCCRCGMNHPRLLLVPDMT